MEYKKADLSFIIEDAKKNGRVDGLKELASKKVKGKDGKMRKISFIELKYQYYERYMPEHLPVKKSAKTSMYNKIMSL